MAEGERATGTPNTIYDLSSVLFHALEGGASYDTFIEDAEREGDQELADFFRQVRDEDSNRADRAQQLLAERSMQGTAPGVGAAEGATTIGATEGLTGAGTAPIVEPGLTEPDVPPRTEPIGAQPGMEDPLARTEEVPPPRVEEVPPGTGEAPPLTEDRPLGAEDRPIGTEGTMPPRTEGAPRLEEEGAERGREEDKGLIDRAIDKISGRGEEERDRPDRRI